ncbi:MAG: cytochrome c oxidase assembly protein [Actinomycetota bacterium]|nr:cytochrome c oxidase assembly protein [Actinomycetota bacterium]
MATPDAFWPGGIGADARFDPSTAVPTLGALVAYLGAVRAARRRDRPWSPTRTWAFVIGVLLVLLVTQSGIGAVDDVWYSAHMVEHLVLGMAAPMLVALAAPLTLAARAGSRSTQLTVVELTRLAPVRFLTRPVVALALFVTAMATSTLPVVVEAARASGPLHTFLHLHAFLSGLVFASVVLGTDPSSWRTPPFVRVGLVVVTIPAHALLAIAAMAAGVGLADAEVLGTERALADQDLGAALFWIGGELIGLTMLAVVAVSWFRSEQRRARRHDAALDASPEGSPTLLADTGATPR